MKKLLPLLLLLALLLTACSESAPAATESAASESPASESAAPETAAADRTLIRLNGADADIRGGGARDEGSVVAIRSAGTYELSGTSGEKALVVDTGDDPMDVTLILNNVQITNLSGPALHVRQAKHFRLILAAGSVNTLSSGSEEMLKNLDPNASGAALYSEDDMDIEGEGALTVYGYLNNAIGCKKDLDLNSGSVAVLAANNGVKGNHSVQIKGGSLSVSAWGDGVKSETKDKEGKGYVEISGGDVSVEVWGDGIQAATELRVTGGSLRVTARGDGAETGSKALKAETLIRISDGSLVLESLEDGLRCVNGDVEISGGDLQIQALEDGIRAGEKNSGLGDVRISGGSLRISAGKQAVKARGSFSFSGGSLSALCGSGKQSAPAGGPCLLCAISGPQGDTVRVGELAQLNAAQSYSCLLVCGGELSSGQTLTVSNRLGSVEAEVR